MAKRGRGSNTHGHGTHKRGKGNRGGKGFAGSWDHRKLLTLKGGKHLFKIAAKRGKYGHIGKYGFTRGKLKKEFNVVNLSWLDERFEANETVDITKLGFDKLLGSGKITKPLKIIAPYYTKKAEEKVKAIGGEIIAKAN